MTDRPVDPLSEVSEGVPEGESTAAPSPEGFGDAAGEAPAKTEVEEQVPGDVVAGDAPGTAEERPDSAEGSDVDTEEEQLAAMKGSLADLTNDLQRLQAEYANYRKRGDRDRQMVDETSGGVATDQELSDWLDKSLSVNENIANLWLKARYLERLGKKAEAIKAAEAAMAKATPQQADFKAEIQRNVDNWKK